MNMMTVSGREFAPARLMPADIRIEDIAHALSLICRFGGHTTEHYSVAQHSLLVQRILADRNAPAQVRLAGLLHDAHEAYTGDTPTPIKRALGTTWAALEMQAASAVQEAFGLKDIMRQNKTIIKQADLIALATERRDVTSFDTNRNAPWNILSGVSPFREPACCGAWTPRWWAEQFMLQFMELRDTAAMQADTAAA